MAAVLEGVVGVGGGGSGGGLEKVGRWFGVGW